MSAIKREMFLIRAATCYTMLAGRNKIFASIGDSRGAAKDL